MICRDCGHCRYDVWEGNERKARCLLHNRETDYWKDDCPDNDGLHYDPYEGSETYDDESESDFDDEQEL